jgi:probable phosphoglycerate mutase
MSKTQIDASGRRIAIDGAVRRRIYLFRHGAVDYIDRAGNVVPDTENVDLNPRGRAQSVAMRELFATVHLDRAVCSGLPRTRQTGEAVLGERPLTLETLSQFAEIRPKKSDGSENFDIVADVAYSHWRAQEEGATFLGGERYSDFYQRICTAIRGLLHDSSWHNVAVFAHGGTNAAILGWVTGLDLAAFGMFDQATCCLNVIDIDVDKSGQTIRKTVRAMNVTADDPPKAKRHAGDMEAMARWMMTLDAQRR